MAKIIRLTENDLTRLVRKVINERDENNDSNEVKYVISQIYKDLELKYLSIGELEYIYNYCNKLYMDIERGEYLLSKKEEFSYLNSLEELIEDSYERISEMEEDNEEEEMED